MVAPALPEACRRRPPQDRGASVPFDYGVRHPEVGPHTMLFNSHVFILLFLPITVVGYFLLLDRG